MDRRRFLRAVAVGAGALGGCTELPRQPVPGDGDDVAGGPPTDSEFDEAVRERAREVGEAARESVVVAEAAGDGPTRTAGTAWFLDPAVLATTGHGVAGADAIICWTVDGASFDATVVGRTDGGASGGDDVGALSAAREGPTLAIGDSAALEEGQPLVQVGHPYAVGNWVTSLGRYAGRHDHFGTLLSTLPTTSGNSGSPVLTLDGEVIGLTTGEVPRELRARRRGEAPEPASPRVHEEFVDHTYANHHDVETVRAYVERWT